ncbi:hypothetical protein [Nesterenkonia muleiensis]|uniref:hypothetical protein n=1 Tax=Nesterenkonia muleiensis TaxID=2282648 RepID=UPI000E733C86|nr:hypothetical protein [Nesterenkonia muleiensis]
MNSENEPHTEVGGVPLPTRLLDGYQVHRAALARDLNTLALPRQVLLAGTVSAVPSELSYTHGVPEASGLSAVTFAQDHRLKRALLDRAKLPTPTGASFSWKSISEAEKWAEKIGYPVILREGVGENPVRAIGNITSGEQLRAAFNELRRRDKADRTPGSNPHTAGYATTRLTFTFDEEGNEVAPLRSRMLVEKQMPGRTVRAFVIGDELVAAVELDTDDSTGVRSVKHELSAEDVALFTQTAAAVPGLACATVDAVQNPESPQQGSFPLLITGISERPRIETYASADAGLGDVIGDALLNFQAGEAQVDLPAAVSTIFRRIEVEGLRHADQVAKELPSIAESYGARISVEHSDAVSGDVVGTASGTPEVLAALVELLMAGCLVDDRAAAVNYSKGSSVA